jgi:hypothetical protein
MAQKAEKTLEKMLLSVPPPLLISSILTSGKGGKEVKNYDENCKYTAGR